MADIDLNIDDYLELDFLEEKIDNGVSINTSPSPSSSDDIQNIARRSAVFDPTETGMYELKYNGEKLSINVYDIPDSDVQYDSTNLSGFSDGDSISQWDDEQGSNNLTQNTSSKQPVYKTNVLNSNPIVRFDGSDDLLQTTFGSTITQPNHVFIVAKINTIQDHYFFDGDNRDEQLAQTLSGKWSFYAGSSVSTGTADKNPHIHNVLFDGGSSTYRLDGSQIMSGDPGNNDLTGFTVANAGDESFPMDVDFGEILIYDRSLTVSERDEVESYLSDKWGIAI